MTLNLTMTNPTQYYAPEDNELVFPAGVLQPPYFSSYWPSYLTYGAFGAVAGHELTHAFDNTGRLYDGQGRLRDWMSDETIEGFEERKECLIRQYDRYTVVGARGRRIHVKGKFTVGVGE